MTEPGVGLDHGESLEGDLMERKEGPGIHVMLDKGIADHDVAHLHSLGESSGNSSEKDSGNLGIARKQAGRVGGIHLAATAENHGDRLLFQTSVVDFTTGDCLGALMFESHLKVPEFGIHCCNDACSVAHNYLIAVPGNRRIRKSVKEVSEK